MSRKTKEAVQGAIYILPSFVLILIFCIIPIFMSGYFSFTEYNIMNSPKFVGLDNYIKMFKDSYVTDAAKNTLLYVVMTVPAQTILALAFAAFLAAKIQNKKGEFLRSVMFIPVIASAVTAGTVWRIILNTDGGFLNNILNFFHISSVNWLGSTKTSLLSICIVAVWKNVGYFLVIYYAGIMGIQKDLYEAARVDGLGYIGSYFRVVLPLSGPLISTLAILNFTSCWNAYLVPSTFLAKTEKFTLAVGLNTIKAANFIRPNETMAGVVLLSFPVLIVFFFLQKGFIEGIANSGIKG